MNREDFILSASAQPTNKRSAFTDAVMRKINTPEKPNVWYRLRHLHGPALAAAIIAAVFAVSGVAYAATVLWNIVNEGINESGRQEYSVQGATSCNSGGAQGLSRFEIKRDAPKLSDEESRKIIRAACELGQLNQLVRKLQPEYDHKQQPKVGDTMRYVASGVVGVAKSVGDSRVSVEAYGRTIDYATPQGKSYKLYDTDLHATSQPLTPGDVVAPILLMSVVYTESNTHTTDAPDQRIIAAMKLSLPIEYYTTYQSYVTEAPACIGNPDELCPNTASIDVFPRGDGEGSQNQQLSISDGESAKQISGVVTAVDADTVTLKTRSGAEYTFTVGDKGFETYNTKYAPNYTDVDAHIVPGSSVMVMYYESPSAHSNRIGPTKIMSVTLMLEGKSPKESVNPY